MIRNAIHRFMYGRYGNDSLNLFLIVVYLFLYLLFALTHIELFYWISLALVFVSLFRLLSRNIPARQKENSQFMRLAGPVIQWYRLQRTMRRDKDHRYFKCPNCGQYLRVPRGKGKITVSCRNCGASFEERS